MRCVPLKVSPFVVEVSCLLWGNVRKALAELGWDVFFKFRAVVVVVPLKGVITVAVTVCMVEIGLRETSNGGRSTCLVILLTILDGFFLR